MDNSQYISIANDDYESSCLLYKSGKYTQALYHFTQSVEKICKYVLLESKMIDSEKLRDKIGHSFIKVIRYYLIQSNANSGGIFDTEINETINSFESIFNDKNPLLKIAVSTEMVKKYSKQISVMDKIDGETFTDFYIRVTSIFNMQINEKDIEEIKKIEQMEGNKDAIEEYINQLLSLHNVSLNILFILFSITIYTAHYQLDNFRYPSSDIKDPVKFFDSNNIFVTSLPFFQNHFYDFVLRRIKNVKWSF